MKKGRGRRKKKEEGKEGRRHRRKRIIWEGKYKIGGRLGEEGTYIYVAQQARHMHRYRQAYMGIKYKGREKAAWHK